MSNLHISEFSGLAATDQSDSVLAFSSDAHVTDQSVGIVAATSTPSQPFSATTLWILVTAGAACSIKIGAPGVIAAAGEWFLNAGDKLPIRVNPGQVIANFPDTL